MENLELIILVLSIAIVVILVFAYIRHLQKKSSIVRLSEAHDQLSLAHAEMERLSLSNKSLTEARDDVRFNLTNVRNIYNDYKKEVAKYKLKVKNIIEVFEAKLKDKDSTIEEMKVKINALNKIITSTEKDLSRSHEVIKELEVKANSFENDFNIVEKGLQALNKKLTEAERKAKDYEVKYIKETKDSEDILNICNELQKEILDAKKSSENDMVIINNHIRKNIELEKEYKKLQKYNSEVEDDYANLVDENIELKKDAESRPNVAQFLKGKDNSPKKTKPRKKTRGGPKT
jgi:chromosome segregation ATPase